LEEFFPRLGKIGGESSKHWKKLCLSRLPAFAKGYGGQAATSKHWKLVPLVFFSMIRGFFLNRNRGLL